MKDIWSLPVLLISLCLSSFAGAQAGITLLVKTDMSCNWKLDGQPMGVLAAEDPKVVLVSPGEHLIEASTADGVAASRNEIEVDKVEKTVDIQLKSKDEQQLKIQEEDTARKRAGAALTSTWSDLSTGLMWAREDNGSDVDWNRATAYCSDLKLAGYKDWRLPTIDELKGIDDPSIRTPVVFDNGTDWNVHVKGNLKLTGWQWSSSPGIGKEKPWPTMWFFHFGNERSFNTFAPDMTYSLRALCVRRAGKRSE